MNTCLCGLPLASARRKTCGAPECQRQHHRNANRLPHVIESRRERQSTPEARARQRERQNGYFKTNQKYRDRHRAYMRTYMRQYRAARKSRLPAPASNNSAQGT